MRNQALYHAFLLKLWPVVSKTRVLWRVILENPHTGERHGFKDLEALMEFLRTLTQQEADPTRSRIRNGNDDHAL